MRYVLLWIRAYLYLLIASYAELYGFLEILRGNMIIIHLIHSVHKVVLLINRWNFKLNKDINREVHIEVYLAGMLNSLKIVNPTLHRVNPINKHWILQSFHLSVYLFMPFVVHLILIIATGTLYANPVCIKLHGGLYQCVNKVSTIKIIPHIKL